jgi:hydrogenase maturation protease
MKQTVIIGFGNLLMRDDGVGIHVVHQLLQRDLPPEIEVIDGGVASFVIFDSVRDAEQIIIIDAVETGEEPGSIYRFTPEELGNIQPSPSYSLHEVSLIQSLHLARKMGPMPPVCFYGVEPADMSMGMELTPSVAAAVTRLIEILEGEWKTGV